MSRYTLSTHDEARLDARVSETQGTADNVRWVTLRVMNATCYFSAQDLRVVNNIIASGDIAALRQFLTRPASGGNAGAIPAPSPAPLWTVKIATEIICMFVHVGTCFVAAVYRQYVRTPPWHVIWAKLGCIVQNAILLGLCTMLCLLVAWMFYVAFQLLSGIDLEGIWDGLWGVAAWIWNCPTHASSAVGRFFASVAACVGSVGTGLFASVAACVGSVGTGLHASMAWLSAGISGFQARASYKMRTARPSGVRDELEDLTTRFDALHGRFGQMERHVGFHTGEPLLTLSRRSGIHLPSRMPFAHVPRKGGAADGQTLEARLQAYETGLQTLTTQLATVRQESDLLAVQLATVRNESAGLAAQLDNSRHQAGNTTLEVRRLRRDLYDLRKRANRQEKRQTLHAWINHGSLLVASAAAAIEGAATVTGMAGYWMMAKMGLDFVATIVCEYGALHVLEE